MKRWIQQVLILLCCSLAAEGAVRAADTVANAAAKEDPPVKAKVSIQMPHGWLEIPDAKALTASRAPQADKDQTGGFQALLTVTMQAGKLDAAAQQLLLAQQFTGYRPTGQPQALTINGMKGVYIGGTFTHNNTPLRTRVYLLPMKDKTCIITFTCLASRWAAYQQELDASVNSLSVKH